MRRKWLLTFCWIIVSPKMVAWSGSCLEYPTIVGPNTLAKFEIGIWTASHVATLKYWNEDVNILKKLYWKYQKKKMNRKYWNNLCKCRTKKANVSRLAFGNRPMACCKWFKMLPSMESPSKSTTALENTFHSQVGMSGSRKPLKKVLMQPQMTCISTFDRSGTSLSRKNRSLSALISFSEPDTR